MKAGQATFISGLVLGAALGFSAGHVLVWSSTSKAPPSRDMAETQPVFTSESPFFSTALPIDATNAGDEAFDFTEMIDEDLSFSEMSAPQSGTVYAEAQVPSPAQNGIDEPQTLPPSPASPLTTRSDAANERRLQNLLDSELSDATAEEREIWIDVLRDMPPEDALGVLRMWKKFGPSEMPGGLTFPDSPKVSEPAADVLTPIPPEMLTPLPIEDHGIGDHAIDDQVKTAPSNRMIERLRRARRIVLENLANAYAWGYKRQDPFLARESSVEAEAATEPEAGSSLPRFDFTSGEPVWTGVPLDWAIVDGPAFFEVTDGEQSLFTRCGHFSIDSERRVCLDTPRGRLHLVPEVVVTAEAARIKLSPDGHLSVVDFDGGETELAHLSVATFLNPAGLESLGHGLFAETPESGRPSRSAPSEAGDTLIGIVRQHYLERSNVDAVSEFALLEHIDRVLGTLLPECSTD
ncbi:Flagellar basal-body rod protein FlgG [Maioricimonas rarisocia]|uniref:Flagellar basal-body rod protein FlgG n=1 Tax=Maioricimonas rarisocia TaxID=2528026 RepID=A0A517ZC61_9PLAN|nr:flagellar hook basal-body protein [Maioricimonas rarisocia]QDU40094.1 Flagellar basal-body rod protein FlgG [Maioricimonas rarisocia]